MSGFSEELHAELLGLSPQKTCCRRSMLAGLLINADCGVDGSVYMRLSGQTADLAARLLADVYGRETAAELSNCYCRVTAEAVITSDRLSSLLSGLSDPATVPEPPAFLRCRDCAGFFFAGIMLSSGTVGNPERGSRAEIRVNDPARASKLIACFSSHGVYPVLSGRRGITSLLFRSSDSVETLLALCGATSSAMSMMQYKMVRELRGDINRRSNCEVSNLVRTAGAARAQLDAVARLRADGRLSGLSDELRYTAGLRESFPEASLAELAAMHDPPITKSGLNHRLEKIIALAGTV